MKDKNTAGILALFLGWLGFHRFYLGQTGLGIVYFMFCWFPLIWLIAFVDAISLFAMDQQRFDAKYNTPPGYATYGGRQTDFDRNTSRTDRRTKRWEERREESSRRQAPAAGIPSAKSRANPFKQSGVEKFKDFDYAAAIEDFKKSLEIEPRDVATHFNLACAYSLTEAAGLAFRHLSIAVENGFRDFQKIKEHHALAYLRIQPEFENFEQNGFRLPPSNSQDTQEDLLSSQPDLLDQLKKLGELRAKGLLTEQEFVEQKKKLLG
jgi:TM2 domain-containing membrane protein YozV